MNLEFAEGCFEQSFNAGGSQEFMGKNYLENFVQATFDALKATGVPVEGGTMVVSGDGRFYNKVLRAWTYLRCLDLFGEFAFLCSSLLIDLGKQFCNQQAAFIFVVSFPARRSLVAVWICVAYDGSIVCRL